MTFGFTTIHSVTLSAYEASLHRRVTTVSPAFDWTVGNLNVFSCLYKRLQGLENLRSTEMVVVAVLVVVVAFFFLVSGP